MRIVSAFVVAGTLALTSGALAPDAADARSDRATQVSGQADGHDDRSYRRDEPDDHDSSGDRDDSNGRDESSEHDESDRHDESDERDWPESRDRSNDHDRSERHDRSDERNRREGRDGSDERDESGSRDRSSRRGQPSVEATQAPDQTPAQSAPVVPPSAPATSPTPPASAPQTQAPARGDENAPRPAERGSGTRERGEKAPRPTSSGPRRQGNRDDSRSGDSAPPAFEGFAAPAAAGGGDPPRSVERSDRPSNDDDPGSPVVRTVRDIVEIVPGWMKLAIAGLAALSLLLAGGYAASALRARSLARQRSELLGEVGLLQAALLPAVPTDLGALKASVAYKPADGPAAGGDFYDVVPLPDGRCGFILGDLSGHGRDALERTAFMRYTLRAYIEAGLEPRVALQVAGRVIGNGLGSDFATVLLAVHDPRDGSLTFAGAGHPAPIVVGGTPFEPVVAGSSPPLGIGERTGLRQTTVPLMPRSVACLFTDGLIEARTADSLLGRERLEQIVAELGDEASASDLLERVSAEADLTPDDMATCLLTPRAGVTSGGFRSEQLELSADELDGPLLTRFLDECGLPDATRDDATDQVRETATRFGSAVVSVVFGSRRRVHVVPGNVESLESASRRVADGTAMAARAS